MRKKTCEGRYQDPSHGSRPCRDDATGHWVHPTNRFYYSYCDDCAEANRMTGGLVGPMTDEEIDVWRIQTS
jgi:hypothetical protein